MSAAIVFLKGLNTNSANRTKKKNSPEKIVFLEKNESINNL